MSILIKDFNGTDLIGFKQENYTISMTFLSIDSILLFLGIAFGTLVIASLFRIRSKSVDNLFVLSLCCTDLIFNLYSFTSGIILLASGGWSMGSIGLLSAFKND